VGKKAGRAPSLAPGVSSSLAVEAWRWQLAPYPTSRSVRSAQPISLCTSRAAAFAPMAPSRSMPRQNTWGHSSASALTRPKMAPRCALRTPCSPASTGAAAPERMLLTMPRQPSLFMRAMPTKKQRPTLPPLGVTACCRCGCRCFAASSAQRSCAWSSPAQAALCW